MRVFGGMLGVVLAGLLTVCVSVLAAAQPSDLIVAEGAMGPQWKDLSRRAGMIFAGTVLSVAASGPSTYLTSSGASSTVELQFRVDHPIAGVEAGQILTIREWAGAWSMHRPMRRGQHILLFLYPPSRLGFTSPIGGSLGQVALDSSGTYVSNNAPRTRQRTELWSDRKVDACNVSVVQLERAIRRAREE
jgi:hypothetical protein